MQDKKPDAELEAKFDLDIVEVPKVPVNEMEQEPPEPKRQTESKQVSDASEPKSSKKKTYLILSLAVALFLLTFSILWMTKVIRLPGLNHEADSATFNDLYTHIGPVSVAIEKTIVSLTLTVKCSSVESKEKVIRKDAIIKDKIISYLKAPDIYNIIFKREYDHLKSKLKKMVNDTFGEELIEEVYLSEIMLY